MVDHFPDSVLPIDITPYIVCGTSLLGFITSPIYFVLDLFTLIGVKIPKNGLFYRDPSSAGKSESKVLNFFHCQNYGLAGGLL